MSGCCYLLVASINGKAFEKFPWQGRGTPWPEGRRHRRNSHIDSSEHPDTHRGRSGGRCRGESAGWWAHSHTGMSTATTRTHYTLSLWPVNSPGDDRKDRPKELQHKGLEKGRWNGRWNEIQVNETTFENTRRGNGILTVTVCLRFDLSCEVFLPPADWCG